MTSIISSTGPNPFPMGFYLGLILFFITFVVLALSKLLLFRLQRNEGRRT